MDHHGVHAHQLQQHHIGGELFRHGALAHGVAAVFDDHGFAVINLDIGQGLGERLRRLPATFFGLPFGLLHDVRSIAAEGAEVTTSPRRQVVKPAAQATKSSLSIGMKWAIQAPWLSIL
ncbi:hypothetical protein D3C80_1260110 [compost metagenome]